MAFGSDLSALDGINELLEELSSIPSRASAEAAKRIEALIHEGFDQGDDAYGQPWAPLAPRTLAKGRTPPPLTDTRAMRESVHVTPQAGAGVSVTIDHPGLVHQTGGKKGAWVMPARPILPHEGELPESWEKAISDSVDEAYAKARGA